MLCTLCYYYKAEATPGLSGSLFLIRGVYKNQTPGVTFHRPPPNWTATNFSIMPSYLAAPTLTKAVSDQSDLKLAEQRKPGSLQCRRTRHTAVYPRPIPNSYWATPLLLACEYPWSPKTPNRPKLDALLRAGVRTFIDLTECGELMPYASMLSTRAVLLGIDESTIEYHRFPIRDRSPPESVDYMYKVLTVLRDNESRNRISAVHCRGGIGRTGMVVGCWLVESGYATCGNDALEIVAREWKTVEKCIRFPHSPETGPQFEFVMNFKATPKSLKIFSA